MMDLQIERLRRELGVSKSVAKLIAALAYGERKQ